MSDPKATAPPEAYYASGSYQQGGTPAAVSTANDQEYAQRLQNEEFRNAQQQQQHHQVLPTVTGQIIRPGDGMQYVPMYPPANAFDPADLGVSGTFVTPGEVRLFEAFSLGRTVRILAVLDGFILLLNCASFPVLFLLIVWAPVAGWMAGTQYSTGWTYVYCAYYVMRLSLDLAYIIIGYLWFILMFVLNLIISRYIFRFAKVLNSLTPAEIEQLRHPSATWATQYRGQQPFQVL